MEKKVNKKGMVQEYVFGKNIRVHRHIHDPEHWFLTAMNYGFDSYSLCSINANEQAIITATWRVLAIRRDALSRDIKDISDLIETPF